jgi:hypothetical protein
MDMTSDWAGEMDAFFAGEGAKQEAKREREATASGAEARQIVACMRGAVLPAMREVKALLEARGRAVAITEPGMGDTPMAIDVKHGRREELFYRVIARGKGDGKVEVATRIRTHVAASGATTEAEGSLHRGAEVTKDEVIGDILAHFKDAIRMPVG